MDIVREMRQQGLAQGTDFDFAYYDAKISNNGWEAVEPRQTVFKFHTEKYATWFAIKWA